MSETTRTDRRTVIKGAAWAAPAIVVATAVPAFAASTAANVRATLISTVRTGNSVAYSATITNTGTNASVGLRATVVFASPSPGANFANPNYTPTATGWTFVSLTRASSNDMLTAVFDAAPQVAGGGTKGLSFSVLLQNAGAVSAGTSTTTLSVTAPGTAQPSIPTSTTWV